MNVTWRVPIAFVLRVYSQEWSECLRTLEKICLQLEPCFFLKGLGYFTILARSKDTHYYGCFYYCGQMMGAC